jgi:hypothetical protein
MHTENPTEQINDSGFKQSIAIEQEAECKFFCIAIEKKDLTSLKEEDTTKEEL